MSTTDQADTPIVEKLLTQAEAAAVLRVSIRSLYALRRAGKLCAVLVGDRVRFDPADIQQFIDAAKEGGGHE